MGDHGIRNHRTSYSWPVIIIVLIIFWPVGLYLLYKRFSVDKSATLKNGKTVGIIAWVLIVMSALCLIQSSENADVIGPSLLFISGGICLLFVARKMKKNGEKYKKYIALIVNHSQTSIDNITSAVGVPYEVAIKDLQKMIDSGYFAGAFINLNTREIMLSQITPQPSVSQYVQPKIVKCTSCGANNTVVGQISECEYCGSPVQ